MSADAIVRGRASLILPINVWWTRDQFIGGEKELRQNLKTIIEQGLTHKIILEKSQSVAIWKEIVALADKIQTGNPELRRYLQTSAKYGLLLYSIYEQGWIIMLKGYEGDMNGQYDTKVFAKPSIIMTGYGKNTNYSERLIRIVPHFMSLIVLTLTNLHCITI